MSTDSTALVTIDKFLKLLNSSTGRDQCNRLIQYGSKILDDALTRIPSQPNKELITRVRALGAGAATARKVFRFWRPLTGYLAVIRFIQRLIRLSKGNPRKEQSVTIIEVLRVIEQACLAQYFLFDHFNWAGRLNLLSDEKITEERSWSLKALFNNSKTARYNTLSSVFWMYGVIAGVVATTMELTENENKQKTLLRQIHEVDGKRIEDLRVQLDKEIVQRKALIRKGIVGLCDIGVAMSFAGYWQTKESVVGLLGVIPASILIYESWPSQ